MTKSEIVEIVAEATKSPKKKVGEIFDSIFNTMQESLSEGERVNIPGFGSFTVKERAARQGVNPKTLEKIEIPSSKNVRFAAAKNLKSNL